MSYYPSQQVRKKIEDVSIGGESKSVFQILVDEWQPPRVSAHKKAAWS